jgi:hypothetical protein
LLLLRSIHGEAFLGIFKQMQSPPEFLRAVVDGAFESVFIVLSNGTIWHMNEPSRRLFRVPADNGCGTPTSTHDVSTYLSFCTAHAPNLEISWEEFISGELSTSDKCTTSGIGTFTCGGNFPLAINCVKVDIFEGSHNGSGRDHRHDNCYYFLYMQDVADKEILDELQNQIKINHGIMNACKLRFSLNYQVICLHVY